MKKLMKGNEAIAEAAVRAGCKFFFGYPITPQNEIPEYMSRRLPEAGGCFLQAESEISAINMVYGAGGAGARVMTSSSSPGISLKQEGISYLVGAEVPCVIVNIMRCGPGLGGIQPAQSDYYQATRGGGHGDYRTCVLAPASVQEAVDLTQAAFDIADRYRNPVMILGDGMIGQMMEPVEMDNDYHPAVDLSEKSWAANGHLPTPGRPRSVINSLYIDPKVLERHCERLESKYKKIAERECRWQEEMLKDAEVVVVAYGTTSRVARSAIRKCREQGIKAGMLRPVTLWPFPTEAIRKTIPTAKHYLAVEMSAGQMVDDVRLAVNGERPVHFYGRMGGMVPTVSEVVEEIKKYAEPSHKSVAEIKLEIAVDDKLKSVTDAMNHILAKAGRTIGESRLCYAGTAQRPETGTKTKEAEKMLDDHSFDEIEAKFLAALAKMKQKLKEAGEKIDATSSEEMEHKVKVAAETLAQRIKDAAHKMERKMEETGAKPGKSSLDEIEDELDIAAEEMNRAFETASETMAREMDGAADAIDHALDQAAGVAEQAVDQAAGAVNQAAVEPEKPAATAASAPIASSDDDEDDDDDDDEDDDDDDDDDEADEPNDHAAGSPDDKVKKAAEQLDEKVEAAGRKLDDLSMDDVEEKLKSAAKAVEEKMHEAGMKIDEFLNDPAVQQKAEGAGHHITSFFERAGKSIAAGIESFMKAVTHAADNVKNDLGEKPTKADEPKDKEDE